ncbi:phosphotransferase [Pseudopelagicola sp. nBUS_19]|uniref:phosphotransferase n=1 Tax=Pseudopelagicola sp. nBUS_19 TaxID=3395316 RepID=UPI003EBEADC1
MIEDPISRAAQLPCFDNPDQIQLLSGGITNVNLQVTDGDRRYVVRFGEDIPEHGVLRWNELALSRAAESAGISPAVHYHEPGVLVLDFIEAQTYTEEVARDPKNVTRIVDLLKHMHYALAPHLTAPVLTFWPFQVNRTYATRLRTDGSRYTSKLSELMVGLNKLEDATGPVSLVIGHNDLLAANILDDKKKLWLIDWEYGGFNTPLFDLAGLAGNNGYTEVQEQGMLEQYFDVPAATHWRAYQAMKCISLMRETLWSMTSEIHSSLDFDYVSYTAENMYRLNAALQDFQNT